MTQDALIRNKTVDQFERVINPKVYGTLALDEVTANEQLDLMVLFSSVAGALGNMGQTDYAYGNSFLDAFAHRRNQLCHQQLRSGRTLSINWPYWQAGGMTLTPQMIATT